MAKPRKVPHFTPEEQAQTEAVNEKYKYELEKKQLLDTPKPVARPLLPNFYHKGGKVLSCRRV